MPGSPPSVRPSCSVPKFLFNFTTSHDDSHTAHARVLATAASISLELAAESYVMVHALVRKLTTASHRYLNPPVGRRPRAVSRQARWRRSAAATAIPPAWPGAGHAALRVVIY